MAREPLAWISTASVLRASRPSAVTLRTAPRPGRRSVGSGTTWTGRPSSRPRDATSPSSGTTRAGAQRSRASPRKRSIKLSSPPPTTRPWFDTTRIDDGSSTLVDHQDPQPVGRSGVEVVEHVQSGGGRTPEQRDQARSIEEELAAVEHDETGARLPSGGEQLVRPDARQGDPAALAVEGDQRLSVEQDRVTGLGLGDP